MSETKKKTKLTKTIWTYIVVVVVIAVAVWAIFTYVIPKQDEEVTPTETVTTDTMTTDATEVPPANSGILLVWENMDYVA